MDNNFRTNKRIHKRQVRRIHDIGVFYFIFLLQTNRLVEPCKNPITMELK